VKGIAVMLSPILRDFPDSFETERLLIRSPRPGEGAQAYEAVMEPLDDLRKWMPWAQSTPTVEELEEVSRRGHSEFMARTNLPLRLWHKSDGVLVGASGLHLGDWSVPRFDIGYWCRAWFQGQGYITEAVRGITRFGFQVLGAQRLEIRCDTRNERSRRVAERAGYRLEGTLRCDDRAMDGSLRDTLVFGAIPADYSIVN
jgi:RimJ/RimL family protein N-acetyltransferase